MALLRASMHGFERPTRARALIIDDDENVCEILYDGLIHVGYAVATAPDGAAALELVKAHPPAVILLEPDLSDMDGWTFVELYRSVARPVAPIVVVSWMGDLEERVRRIGAAGYVRKPFEITRIVGLVQSILAEA